MPRLVRIPRIYLSSGFYIWLSTALLMVPLRWIAAWVGAAFIHEIGHYITLRLFDVGVESVEFCGAGCVMKTAPVYGLTEVICAAVGPVASLLLVFLWKDYPRLAICALLQCMYNLLPIYPLDGGRIFFALIKMLRSKNTLQSGSVASTIYRIK